MPTLSSVLEASRKEAVPKENLKVLSVEVGGGDDSLYRIQAGSRVHYLTAPGEENAIFDAHTQVNPLLLIPKLPAFPDSDWTCMRLFQGPNGEIDGEVSYEPLAGVDTVWHPRYIEITNLNIINKIDGRVHEVEYEGKAAIAKSAAFEWEIPQISFETSHPNSLANITEQGRVMGFLLEKVEGAFASIADLPQCEAALRKLHQVMDMVHGDVNRYNFIINPDTGFATLIDFAEVSLYEEQAAQSELEELKESLVDESGVGTTTVTLIG